MSFLRHGETYPSDGGKTLTGRAPAHRLDEFPTGYSLASCSPAEPAPASPVNLILLRLHSFVYEVSANGNLSLIFVSHRRGAAQGEGLRKPSSRRYRDPRRNTHGSAGFASKPSSRKGYSETEGVLQSSAWTPLRRGLQGSESGPSPTSDHSPGPTGCVRLPYSMRA